MTLSQDRAPAALRAPERVFGAYVFDLDGTLYLGERLIPGAAAVVRAIRAAGAQTLFLTNNPTSLPAAYAAKLSGLGIPAARDEIVSSIDALLAWLDRHAPNAPLLPVAEPLLVGLLRDAGHPIVDEPRKAAVVVVAWDRTFDYAKLSAAFRAVRAGARIVATNPDAWCPTPDGGLPDCAAMLAAIEASTGATAEAIVGKPSAHMAATLLDRLTVDPADAVLVGDRLATDVRMARTAGMHAALVLSGATRADEVADADVPPDYVLRDVGELLPSRMPPA